MGKKLSLQLSVPKPCHENWDNMTPNERGRHCDSCNKTVVDFSLFSDRQLIEFFTKATGNICGRVSQFQLQRQYVYSEPTRHPLLKKFLFGTALTAGLSVAANAQQNHSTPPTQQTDKVNEGIESINPAISQEIPQLSESSECLTSDSTSTVVLNDRPIAMMGGMVCVSVPFTITNIMDDGMDEATKEYIENRTIDKAIKPRSAFPKANNTTGH